MPRKLSKAQLTAHRVKRKLLGQSGAPTVTRTEEFWRRKHRYRMDQRDRLSAWRSVLRGDSLGLDIVIVMYADGTIRKAMPLRRVGPSGPYSLRSQTIARLVGPYIVVHKYAPKWLRVWAKREVGERCIEQYAPLTKRNCAESVKFARANELVNGIVERLRGK